MSKYNDFELDITKTMMHSQEERIDTTWLPNSKLDCVETTIRLSKAACSKPSCECSTSDMTACGLCRGIGEVKENILRC